MEDVDKEESIFQVFASAVVPSLGRVSMTSLTLLFSFPSMNGFHEEYNASVANSSLNNKQIYC